MQGNYQPADLIQVCEDIVMRHATQLEITGELLALGMHVKSATSWRAVAFSGAAASRMWDQSVIVAGSAELLTQLANEFVFRTTGFPMTTVYSDLANSLCWGKAADGTDPELAAMTGSDRDYEATLRKNPWLAFLYLLSMSDIIRRLTALAPPPVETPAKKR